MCPYCDKLMHIVGSADPRTSWSTGYGRTYLKDRWGNNLGESLEFSVGRFEYRDESGQKVGDANFSGIGGILRCYLGHVHYI